MHGIIIIIIPRNVKYNGHKMVGHSGKSKTLKVIKKSFLQSICYGAENKNFIHCKFRPIITIKTYTLWT